jgi:hypothetical protein
MTAAIRSVAKALGRRPTREEFDNRASMGWLSVSRRFGGWNAAVSAALGIAVAKGSKARVHNMLNDGHLLDDVRRVATKMKRAPTALEYAANGRFNRTTLHRRFGAWPNVLSAAHIDLR